jgi:two-component system, chemotaxis family, chemotaxis protein CheY
MSGAAVQSKDTFVQFLTIVVADGNQFTRRLTRQMLMNLGCRNIIEAQDGSFALEAVRACKPDVLLVDWKLPILSGEEVLGIIRAPGVFPDPALPIIVHTDQSDKRTVLAAMRAGAPRISRETE